MTSSLVITLHRHPSKVMSQGLSQGIFNTNVVVTLSNHVIIVAITVVVAVVVYGNSSRDHEGREVVVGHGRYFLFEIVNVKLPQK